MIRASIEHLSHPRIKQHMLVAFDRLTIKYGYKPSTANDLTPKEVYQIVVRARKFRMHYDYHIGEDAGLRDYLSGIEDVCQIAPCPLRKICFRCPVH
jgi:hypothetical protein